VPELTARQREIVATARDLLAGEGAEGLTLGRIARTLGIRTPSLYKHFPSRRHLEAVLIAEGMEQLGAALRLAGGDLHALGAAYRRWALANPALYALMTDGPLPRDLLPDGLEDRAAQPLLDAVGGDQDLARAVWAHAHGMVVLELAGRFPPGADLEAAWRTAADAFGRARGIG
jgi:AcrR family transcriptional regulator